MKMNPIRKMSIMATSALLANILFAQVTTPTTEGTTPLGAIDQYRTWSIGVNGGILNQSNLFGFNRGGFDKIGNQVGYSAYVKNQITPSFGLKLQYLGGKVEGSRFEEGGSPSIGSIEERYTTSIPSSTKRSKTWSLT